MSRVHVGSFEIAVNFAATEEGCALYQQKIQVLKEQVRVLAEQHGLVLATLRAEDFDFQFTEEGDVFVGNMWIYIRGDGHSGG